MAFLAFHTSDGVSRYFSVHDALNVVKAVVAAALVTSLVLFTFNRLEGIPRSTPVLHALILAAGLLSARTLMLLWHNKGQATERVDHSVEHIIMIGTTRLSSLYMKFLQALDPYHRRFIAVLDHQQNLIGRAMCGVPIFASAKYLERVIEDFVVHGIRIDRVMIGGDENLLPQEELNVVLRVCAQREIPLDFVSSMVGLDQFRPPSKDFVPTSKQTQRPSAALPVYFRVRPTIDFVVALTSIIILLPLIAVASLLVLIDVGAPVLFWQQRTGKDGRSFFLYKFRTLRIPFDRDGQPIGEDQRISWIGRLLRKTRIDEFPQLFNVLVGDMSLIGPRPLLPRDQPASSGKRLAVRPGITGWAQVNGGNLVTPEEKNALDTWYVSHASPWLDLRIALLTLRFAFTGERRSEAALNMCSPPLAAGHLPLTDPLPAPIPRLAASSGARNLRPD